MIDLTPFTTDAYLLAMIKCEHGTLKVFENHHYRWLTLGDKHTLQGVMYKPQPHQVCNPVNQAMLLFQLCDEPNTQILNLGLGSGCFERALSNTTDLKLTTVEINSEVINAAKQYFSINDKYNILTYCAEQFIAEATHNFDVILVDIFSGETQPLFLQKYDFWRDCQARLTTCGKICINFAPQNEQQFITVLTLLRKLFNHVIVVEFKQFKNLVLIASNIGLAAINEQHIKQHNDFIYSDLAFEIKKIFYIPKAS